MRLSARASSPGAFSISTRYPWRRTIRLAQGFCDARSEEHTSELQSLAYLVCRLLLEKKKQTPETQSLAYLLCPLVLQRINHPSLRAPRGAALPIPIPGTFDLALTVSPRACLAYLVYD